MGVADSSCLCGGSFSLPLWGVVRRFAGWFSCGWCIGCGLFDVGRCTASGGVWWRFVWRLVGRIGVLSSRRASCGASRLSSYRCACCGAGRMVSRVVVAGRGAARVSPCVSCRVAGSEAWCLFHVEVRGAGPVFSVSVFYPPAPGEGVQSRFCRWWAFFALKWVAFFLVFLSFSIWFSTLKNPRGLFFPRGCSLYGCDGGYWMRRRASISAVMFSAVSSVRNWISSSSMYVMFVSFSCVRRSG